MLLCARKTVEKRFDRSVFSFSIFTYGSTTHGRHRKYEQVFPVSAYPERAKVMEVPPAVGYVLKIKRRKTGKMLDRIAG